MLLIGILQKYDLNLDVRLIICCDQRQQAVLSSSVHTEKTIKQLEFENSKLKEQVKDTLQDKEELASKARQLQDALQEKLDLVQTEHVMLPGELKDTQWKLSKCETSLKANTYCSNLHDENQSMQKEMALLKRMLQESEDKNVQVNNSLHNLRHSLEGKDCEAIASSQKLQEALASSAHLENTIKELKESELEEAQRKLEVKEQSGTDVQEHFNNRLATLQAESLEKAEMVEERSKGLASRNTKLQEHLNWERHSLKGKEHEVIGTSPRLQAVLLSSVYMKNIKQLEFENSKLKEQLKDTDSALQDKEEQACKASELQDSLQEKLQYVQNECVDLEELWQSRNEQDAHQQWNEEMEKKAKLQTGVQAGDPGGAEGGGALPADADSLEWIRAASQAGMSVHLVPHILHLVSKLARVRSSQDRFARGGFSQAPGV
ncbi:hypothetical protein AAFF_G00418470 [Aldrovandia affinis]|uniref:Uncharacterized protein n=1 Tax=Aldrovandia affinis TaxID=143900 RepID=A0AAD7WK39_9TELE|nr:hypothetical protein AAFF_G00418470 [Aldrovandia affinis]